MPQTTGINAVRHAGLEQGLTDNEHADAEDDVGIDIACKCCFDVKNACQVQAQCDDGRRQAERDLFQHKTDDCKREKNQCDGSW